MLIVLSEEYQHSLIEHVDIPERTFLRGFSLVVHDGSGNVVVLFSATQQSVRKVYVFAVHEV